MRQPPDRGGRRRDKVGRGGQDVAPPGVKGNYGEVASALVRAGADPNTPYVDEDGELHNLLMDSIIVENADFALLLIEHGADVYYRDDHKVTMLLQALHRGISNVTEALLNRHASSPKAGEESWVDNASDEGVTPLLAASSEGHVSIVKMLLSTGGADVNAKDKEGTNSLMAAAARGHLEVIPITHRHRGHRSEFPEHRRSHEIDVRVQREESGRDALGGGRSTSTTGALTHSSRRL